MSDVGYPIGFACLAAGGLFLIAGVTGSSLASVGRGKPDHSKRVNYTGGESGAAPTGVAASTGQLEGAAASPAQVQKWAAEGLRKAGVPATKANIATVSGRIMQESGGNPLAVNRTDSNAREGHPSQGLLQTIPSTFSAYHVPGLSETITDPVANVAAAVRYMQSRYGHLVGPGPGGY